MTVAEATEYLNGPEPAKAGISDTVVAALRTQILSAVADAKAAAAKEAAAAAGVAEAVAGESATPSGATQTETAAGAEEGGPDEAMRKWREYCAKQLADAEKKEGGAATSATATAAGAGAAQAAEEMDIPLFKPRSEAAAAQAAWRGAWLC